MRWFWFVGVGVVNKEGVRGKMGGVRERRVRGGVREIGLGRGGLVLEGVENLVKV